MIEGGRGDRAHATIRPARPEDAAAVAALMAELGYPNPESLYRRKIEELAEGDSDRVIVAEGGGAVVGVASLHVIPFFEREGALCRMTSLVVSESWRGRGVGRLLVEAAVDFARSKGCLRCEVTTADRRADAQAFYGRVGFARLGQRFAMELG